VNNATYEEPERFITEKVKDDVMSTGSESRKDTRRDALRNTSERDEAVHLFQPGFTEDDFDSRMDYDDGKSKEQEKRYRSNSIEYTLKRRRDSEERKINNTPRED
jgi:hypothetical protein